MSFGKSYRWFEPQADSLTQIGEQSRLELFLVFWRYLWENGGFVVTIILLILWYLVSYFVPISAKMQEKVPLPQYGAVLALIVSCLLYIFLIYRNQNKSHRFFHRIPHQLKFIVAEVRQPTKSRSKRSEKEEQAKQITMFSERVCNEVTYLLEVFFKCKGFGCCIRWVTKDGNRYCFMTMGRSSSVNSTERNKNTTYLYLDDKKGLAYHLNNSPRKVLKLTDIHARDIIDDGIWISNPQSDNEKSIQSLMAFPINIVNGQKKSCQCEMTGILYFTSNKKGWMSPFNSQYVEFGSMVADTLAALWPRFNEEFFAKSTTST